MIDPRKIRDAATARVKRRMKRSGERIRRRRGNHEWLSPHELAEQEYQRRKRDQGKTEGEE